MSVLQRCILVQHMKSIFAIDFQLAAILYNTCGRLAQLVRATGLHSVGHRFEPCAAHHYAHPAYGLI